MNSRKDAGSVALVAEADRRGLSVTHLGTLDIFVFTGFGRQVRLLGTITDQTNHVAVRLADDKRASKALLTSHGLPTPASYAVDQESEAVNALGALGGVVVAKPHNGMKGRGVSAALTTEDQVRRAFRRAVRFSKVILIERYCAGRDYRVLVVNAKVAGVVEREPTKIIGDGIHSIDELVAVQNLDPRRGDGAEKGLAKIKLDEQVEEYLGRSNRTLRTIPQQAEIVILNPIGCGAQGSITIDRTDEIHPEIAALAIKATQLIGLDICGVDMIARDIALPLKEADAQIIEINCSPGLQGHLLPAEGKPRNPAVAILDYLFPETCYEIAVKSPP